MTIIRNTDRERFVRISNETLRDGRLSFRATGVLAMLLSMPDNWKVDAGWLAQQKTDGRDAVRTALKELETHGYLVRRRYQDATGKFAFATVLYETPLPAEPSPEAGYVVGRDQPAPGNPSEETQAERTTDEEQTIKNNQLIELPTMELQVKNNDLEAELKRRDGVCKEAGRGPPVIATGRSW